MDENSTNLVTLATDRHFRYIHTYTRDTVGFEIKYFYWNCQTLREG
jgi:lipopolysaccharide biosynthesis regulator YciM